MPEFELISKMVPKGDQPPAIDQLTERVSRGERYSTLLGVTGSGKTFTMGHTIARVKKPTLVITHNKTLAAQLYAEFKDFFPKNAVHYFVSYYDYYQPEAYIPQRDIYIEKDADINEDIDRLRLAATSALLSRRDVIVVASVSCIYGLGSPEDYRGMIVPVRKGEKLDRHALARKLVDIQYERSDISERGKFRVRGDTVEMRPSYLETGIRVEFDGDVVTRVTEFHGMSGAPLMEYDDFVIYPAKHFVMPEEKINNALYTIEIELEERLKELQAQGRLLELQRLKARTKYDLELLREVGYCKGIENYSRHLSGRKAGEPPATLLDYFPKGDFLCIVDESHATLPQLHGMFNGDRARKQTLVDYGFRLPSALDNRPLRFEEWEGKVPQVMFVSATPSEHEIKMTRGEVVEQIIRPTGLVDPEIEVRPARGQVPDLIGEIKARAERKERALVTTLTKRLAEDLSTYLQEEGVRGKYLHSEIQTFERVEILRELREGKFDVLVGVNLLREGLDLPEVTLVAILDADKEGFLRSSTSIIQTVGRTARNVNGRVILYADQVTDSMKRAMDETDRRRKLQLEYNREHGITPQTIEKEIRKGVEEVLRARKVASDAVGMDGKELDRSEAIGELEKEMYAAAEALDFERAARLRDAIRQITGEMAPAVGGPRRKPRPRGPRITYRP